MQHFTSWDIIKKSSGIAALALAGAFALTGCAAGEPSSPSATRTPAADAETTPPQPTPEAVVALPSDCSETVGAAIRAELESQGLVLNPEWRTAEPETAFGFDALVTGGIDHLECAWLNPRGGSEVHLVTHFVRFDPAERGNRAALAATFDGGSDHRSSSVGDTVLVATTWGENVPPDGYLAAVARFAD